jgi:phage FluMu gp28-like protein
VFIDSYKHKALTEAIGRIKYSDYKFNFKRILIDSTGLGAAVSDIIKEDLKFKVEDITFTMKSKQSMFGNLKLQLEKGRLKLPNHRKLYYQLLDLRYEVSKTGDLKLHHSKNGHDDFPDALALACYYFRQQSSVYVPTIC